MKKAFSIAEAMVVLMLVSIALAMSAPLISRSTKNTATNNLQIGNLINRIEELEKQKGFVPGMVMFFDADYTSTCPEGWRQVDEKYNGRYFRVSGSYNICDKKGEDSNGNCINQTQSDSVNGLFRPISVSTDKNKPGTLLSDASRNIRGGFGAWNIVAQGVFYSGTGLKESIKSGGSTTTTVWFDSSRVVPTADENRPRSISMLTCVKVSE